MVVLVPMYDPRLQHHHHRLRQERAVAPGLALVGGRPCSGLREGDGSWGEGWECLTYLNAYMYIHLRISIYVYIYVPMGFLVLLSRFGLKGPWDLRLGQFGV